ncbi:hypothetical protein [Actinosynnema sp. NPDC020468]|uniref:hypothetical protein n=1 Tax=Actinosynnema sp. NPDC020468 TaxID=3154488 RepID=UPI0033F7C4C3
MAAMIPVLMFSVVVLLVVNTVLLIKYGRSDEPSSKLRNSTATFAGLLFAAALWLILIIAV